jgi:phosphoglycolate phosphatase
VLVGDTPLDVAAARAAGCAVVAVATGRWSIDDLAGTGPDAVLADLTDPAAFLAALDGLTL